MFSSTIGDSIMQIVIFPSPYTLLRLPESHVRKWCKHFDSPSLRRGKLLRTKGLKAGDCQFIEICDIIAL